MNVKYESSEVGGAVRGGGSSNSQWSAPPARL